MKEYFNKKAKELGLDIDEVEKDFTSYLKQNPEFKITKANITKFLKSMRAEPSNMEEKKHNNKGTFLGLNPITGEKVYQ